ncbi:MAG: pilus assembly protein N-terminal domain-containing protein, partial [Planctomycetota bacterium]
MSELAGTVASDLLRGTHERLVFERDVVRVAVGDPETLSAEVLTGGEVLVLGRGLGQTSLLVWFADGTTVSRLFTVRPDLSLLEAALRDIHPSIRVQTAPDRDAVILRGLVPDVTFRTAAEEAAAAYTDTRNGRDRSLALIEAVAGAGAEGTAAQAVRPGMDSRGGVGGGGTVINLIRLESLPPLIDEKLREALQPLTGGEVTIRRVQRGDFADDAADLFVLEGVVPDQVTLAQVLFLASRTVLGEFNAAGQDIRVLADEAGALATTNQVFGSSAIGGAAGQTNFSLGGSASSGGGSSQQSGQLLANRIGANLGRAKVIEAAEGRILSLISVEHLPLVRVDVRIYEVNLTRLRNWRNELGVIVGDFDQGDLLPAGEAVALQGDSAASIGQHDIQNVFNFLDGGVSNRLQFVTEGFAVDEFFQLLVSEEVARSVSRPSLTVLSGELALFQVGGQIPVSIAQTIGGGT